MLDFDRRRPSKSERSEESLSPTEIRQLRMSDQNAPRLENPQHRNRCAGFVLCLLLAFHLLHSRGEFLVLQELAKAAVLQRIGERV